jgi:hypothetical protein
MKPLNEAARRILNSTMEIGVVLLTAIIVGFVGTPILGVYSIRDWATSRSAQVPPWRSAVGIGSLATILSGWLFLVVLTVLRFMNESWRYILTEKMNLGLLLVAVVATLPGVVLKGSARALAIVAGVLLVLLALLASLWLPGDMI